MAGDAQISIVAKAIDQASGTLNRIERSVGLLDKAVHGSNRRFADLNAVLQGAGIGIGIGSFYALERALGRVLRILPDLIGKGAAWASTVKDIANLTGMSAEHASTLAAVQQMVGGTTDGLDRAMIALSRSAVTNQKAFHDLGIQTKDSNGHLLDAYDIFQNVREKISETGTSLLSTNAAQKAFGRGAGSLIDLLKLTDSQWAIYQQEAQKAGLILSDAAVQAGEDWQRTQNVLGATITGLASQIFQGAAPALISLVNGISNAIQQNMDSIVQFAVQAVNFVAGLIGGFLGIDFGAVTLAQKVDAAGTSADQAAPKIQRLGKAGNDLASGTDAGTSAIQRQIDAIDKQIAALDAADRRQQWHKEQHQLEKDIHQARVDLAAVQGEYVFAAGMSAEEAELARQKKEDDFKTAQQKLAEAEKKLQQARRQHSRDVEKQMLEDQKAALSQQMQMQHQAITAQKSMLASQNKALRQWATTQNRDVSKPMEALSAKLQQAAADARTFGQQIADSIRLAIFGGDTNPSIGGTGNYIGPGGQGQTSITIHQEGLISKIGDLINALKPVTDGLSNVFGALGNLNINVGNLITGIAAWKLLNKMPGFGPGGSVPPVIPGGGGGGGGSIWGLNALTGSGWLNFIKRAPLALVGSQSDQMGYDASGNLVPWGSLSANERAPSVQKARGELAYQRDYGAKPTGTGKNSYYGDPFATRGYSAGDLNGGDFNQLFANWQNMLFPPPPSWLGPGKGGPQNQAPLGIEAASGVISAFSPLFDRYLGSGSLMDQTAQDQTSALGGIDINTAPLQTGVDVTLPDGTTMDVGNWISQLGATNPYFASIGKILGWPNSALGVNNANFGNIGDVSSWSAGRLGVAVANEVPINNPAWTTLFSNIGDVSTWSAGKLTVQGPGANGGIVVTTGTGAHILVRPDPNGHAFDVTTASGRTFTVDANTPYGKKLAAAIGQYGLHIHGTVGVSTGLVFKSEAGDEAFWFNGHGTARWAEGVYHILNNVYPGHSGSPPPPSGAPQARGADTVLHELRLLRRAIEKLANRPIFVQLNGRNVARALVGAGSQTSSLRPVPGI